MGQLTIYLPDNLEHEIRLRAKKDKKNISQLIQEMFSKKKPKSSLGAILGKVGRLSADFPDDIEDFEPQERSL